ncbi:hypothetical protein H70357_13360 [Paenibacillus sp. FSL H7-0357]|nr:hypothetical protein H70357_13360 [Paenibacillus sp. FSL H7-0357]
MIPFIMDLVDQKVTVNLNQALCVALDIIKGAVPPLLLYPSALQVVMAKIRIVDQTMADQGRVDEVLLACTCKGQWP